MMIVIVTLWEQPPIETMSRTWQEAKEFDDSIPIYRIWEWAVNKTGDYVKLVSVKITKDDNS